MDFDAKKVQADLITLGYLPKGGDDGVWGSKSKRALTRFQRRAKTIYRLHAVTGAKAPCGANEIFAGSVNGEVTQDTLNEIKKWLDKKWKAPLGYFGFKTIGGGKLREDVADEWQKNITRIKALGGTIDSPYGNTKRQLKKTTEPGTSKYSFHIVGRAIDLNQKLADGGPKNRRYYIAKDAVGSTMFWRIYCRTEKQDGAQGTKYTKDTLEYWDFFSKKSDKAPEGYYLDLTAEIERGGKFERIKAQNGWEVIIKKREWWHFQYKLNIQETFQDECELVGISENDLKRAGYREAEMDHAPG